MSTRCHEGIARERRVDRYYDPATDQFLSVDPDLAETGQPYAYTGNDSVNETDPSGLASKQQVLGTLAEIAYVVRANPQWNGNRSFQNFFRAFLWGVSPINCGACNGPGHGWNDFSSDTAFATASGSTGNERQSACLQGHANSSCGALPNLNPSWATPRGLLTMGLLVTGLISGGLTIEATGIAEGTLEAITVLSGIGSGLEDYNSCVNDRNLVSCIAGGLSIIGVGGSFAAALGGSELLVADGEAVAFEAGGTGGLIDAFQLSGAAGASGNSACSVDITRDGSVRVPEKMGWEPS